MDGLRLPVYQQPHGKQSKRQEERAFYTRLAISDPCRDS
jgi:hypothetical protein